MLADWGVDRDVLAVHPDPARTEHLAEPGAVASLGSGEDVSNGVAVDDIGPRSSGLSGRSKQA